MANAWSFLGLSRLQELIGPSVLERLETLLPALRQGVTPHTIYSRDGLSSIFNSFSGASQLESAAFRAELFNALPEERMAALLMAIGATADGSSWKGKVDKLATAWKSPAMAETILDFLGIPREFLLRQATLPPNDVLLDVVQQPYKPLKEYQVGVCAEAMQYYGTPRSRFVIQMPTGSGKTRTAMEVITQVLNDEPDGTVVVWLAHSEELCEQAYDCFNEVWMHVARRRVRLIRCWGAGTAVPFDFKESALIVGGFAALYARLKKSRISFGAIAPRVRLLIVDEAHRAIAPTYNQVTRALIGDNTRVMGLTATPGRSAEGKEENKRLAQFFFNKMIELDFGKETVLEALRRRGVLSQTEYIPLQTSSSYKLSSRERTHFEMFFDLPSGVLNRLAEDDIRNVEIVRRLQEECKKGGQILFFACSVEHSRFICALLTFLGIGAAHLDGSTNRGRRQSLISDFRAGKVQVLCNYALLSTGFDAPKTDVVFIARPTGSIVLYSQMIGRGLRGPAIGGTERCRIVDVIDNIEGFSDFDRAYHYFGGYFSAGTSE